MSFNILTERLRGLQHLKGTGFAKKLASSTQDKGLCDTVNY